MPKARFKPGIEYLQGTLYDVVFKRSPQGKPIVTKRPDMSNVEWSEAQQDQRFKQANRYARAAMANPEVRAIYEQRAAKEKRKPYRIRIVFSDYFKGNDLLAKK